jgi:hypothetical protein
VSCRVYLLHVECYCGSDGISLKFLKLLLAFIIEHVFHVFNHARSFRLCRKVLLFVQWPKLFLRHVRPITIVSVLSKGFERLINGQILAHVDRSGLLSEFQSRFRCGHSSTTA